MPAFEVAIYNKDVLECVNEGRRHKQLSDDWADTHYLEVNAATEADARRKILTKYPEDHGFVITDISAA